MTENNTPETLTEAIRYFADADNCHDFMIKMRWNGEVECAHCGSKKVGKFSCGKRKVSNCKDCKKQFTVKVGTIFEDSPLGLDKWLPAVWISVNSKNGTSSCELARSLGVTQKTAWHMAHRIRVALESGSFRKLDGVVECDESYIGGAARFMHHNTKKRRGIVGSGMSGKTAVMGLLERHTATRDSRIVAKVIKTNSREILQGNVKEYVLKGSELHTDAWIGYDGIEKEYFHKFVDHAECYVKDGVHTNGLENFWCLLKRSIKGTHVHCAPFHLHRYLATQVFMFNSRKNDDGERFVMAMQETAKPKLTYKKLIGVTA